MRKFLIYLKIHWIKIVLILFTVAFIILIISLLGMGLSTFLGMESFSRNQMMAMMGMYLLMGIVQAFVFVTFLQGANYFFMSGGLIGRLGRETMGLAKVNVKWDEVIGMDSAKEEAWEIVKLLKDRHLLKSIGGKIVKGTLMLGPPGCGKTYLAKAIATECGMPMISVAGSEFVGIFVGQGAAQMKSTFNQARAIAEMHGGCIIFIDEIDAFARPRMADTGFGGGISHNACINQFLTEMDGLRKKENNIVIIAATNMEESELDSAVMRSGRFDRKIHITRPNLKERKQIFEFYLSKVQTDNSINCDILARRATWFTPADIDNLVRESGIIALREKRQVINMKDLSEAYDRVAYGTKSNYILDADEKRWTAYHEAGHAIIGYLFHPKDDIVKATIIPRKGFLGFVSHKAPKESYNTDKEELLARIKISIASYVAENMKFGKTSTGVGGSPSADFYHALSTARSMVWSYGMGKSGIIGDFDIYNRMISDSMKEKLEDDIQDILQTCLKEVREILTQHRELFEYFAEELFKKGELEYDEIQAIFDKFNVQPMSGRPRLDYSKDII